MPAAGPSQPRVSSEELEGLYAKVNKHRPAPTLQNQHQTQADRSDGQDYKFFYLQGPSCWSSVDLELTSVIIHVFGFFNACVAFAPVILSRCTTVVCVGV